MFNFLADLVNRMRIFKRTDCKGSCKIVKAKPFCRLCRFVKAQTVTAPAALASLAFRFIAFAYSIKRFFFKVALQITYAVLYRHICNQSFLLCASERIFGVWIQVGVIIKNGDGKICGKIFDYIAAAGCTAAMQQQRRDVLFPLQL